MRYSTYLRIEKRAGGVYASRKQFIRATRKVLSKQGKTAEYRKARHDFIRQGLAYLDDALGVARKYS